MWPSRQRVKTLTFILFMRLFSCSYTACRGYIITCNRCGKHVYMIVVWGHMIWYSHRTLNWRHCVYTLWSHTRVKGNYWHLYNEVVHLVVRNHTWCFQGCCSYTKSCDSAWPQYWYTCLWLYAWLWAMITIAVHCKYPSNNLLRMLYREYHQ